LQVLAYIDPAALKQRLPYFRRLLETLDRLLEERGIFTTGIIERNPERLIMPAKTVTYGILATQLPRFPWHTWRPPLFGDARAH